MLLLQLWVVVVAVCCGWCALTLLTLPNDSDYIWILRSDAGSLGIKVATGAFTTAGSTPHHCPNLSVAGFAVHSNIWAAAFCMSPSRCVVLSRRRAGQVWAALLAKDSITPTATHTLRPRFATAQEYLPPWRRIFFSRCIRCRRSS